MTTPVPDVFLSYSREDQATARRYAESLKQEGFNVWWDQALSTGEAYDEVTERALEDARAVVVLWSKTSVSSRWVRAEATTADRNGVLMPVMIEPCKRPIMFELRQTAELVQWNGDTNEPAWRAFVADLKRLVLRGQPPEAGELLERAAQHSGATHTAGALPAAVTRIPRGLPGLKILAAAIVAGLLVVGYLGWQHMQRVKQARAAVPDISALVDKGDFLAAFARAAQIRRYIPDDAMLNSLTPLFTSVNSVTSDPEGAEVYVGAYEDEQGELQHVGRTPIAHLELPRQAQRWRFEKAGYGTVERANSALSYQNPIDGPLSRGIGNLAVKLQPEGEQPPGMVYVPGGSSAPIYLRVPRQEVPPFFIDRFEVTNAQFKEFVDAGGYERRSMWEGLDLKKDGRPLAIEEALRLFVDSTDRPGPATWELGSYPEGKGEFPVSGVSWYEAAAYARFRGKSLPTIYHWAVSAFVDVEVASSFVASISPVSNFGTAGPAAAGQYAGLGPYGTYDLFGNVREWLQNLAPTGGGWVIGGSWEDPAYAYGTTAPLPLLERSARNGFRLIKEIGEPANDAAMRAALDIRSGVSREGGSIRPVSDEVFATLRSQFDYRQGPLNATATQVMATTEDWIKQYVTIDAGYGERMGVVLFVPRRAQPPFQPIIVISGSQIFAFPAKAESIEPGFAAMPLDYLVKSGRMLVQPILDGSYERFKTPLDRSDTVRLSQSMIHWRWDLGRTIDYLAARPDVDAARVGYVGVSFGGGTAVPLLAVEPRIKAAVLLSGGLDSLETPFLDSANYAPRIRMPVLMVNGRYDEIFPVETGQLMLFRLLGTPAADKRHVVLEYGHGSPPRGELLRESLGWYDKYLGPVHQ